MEDKITEGVSEQENEITGGVSEKEDQSLCWFPDPANMPLDMVGEEGEMRAMVVCSMVG